MIGRITFDDTWSIGPTGNLGCEIEAETMRSDARSGTEADGFSFSVGPALISAFDPPPIGAVAVVYDTDETILCQGVVNSVSITADGVRVGIDL